jgi:hypothetical protein
MLCYVRLGWVGLRCVRVWFGFEFGLGFGLGWVRLWYVLYFVWVRLC